MLMHSVALLAGAVAGASAAATHPQNEKFTIQRFEFYNNPDGTPYNIAFTATADLAPKKMTCRQAHPEFREPTQSWTCSNEDYQFAAHFPGTNMADTILRLRIYHALPDGKTVYWGEVEPNVDCTKDYSYCVGGTPGHDGADIVVNLKLGAPPNFP